MKPLEQKHYKPLNVYSEVHSCLFGLETQDGLSCDYVADMCTVAKKL